MIGIAKGKIQGADATLPLRHSVLMLAGRGGAA
jgi:hypothetical protein